MTDITMIIDLCDKVLDTRDASDDEIISLIEFTRALLEPINDFVEEVGFDWEDYPREYLCRNSRARANAIMAFASVLEVVGDY